jgi:hypothetical protein
LFGFVVLLITLRQRDHPRFSDLIDPRGPKFIARSLAISPSKFVLNFLEAPQQIL